MEEGGEWKREVGGRGRWVRGRWKGVGGWCDFLPALHTHF